MKKNIIFLLFMFVAFASTAQLVEHYDNPQRFQFPFFSDHTNMRLVYVAAEYSQYTPYYLNAYLSRKYKRTSGSRIVYGIAIPVFLIDSLNDNVLGYAETRWQHTIRFYDTSACSVIIGNKTADSDNRFELESTVPIHFGESALIGNYFKMPDEDSTVLAYYSRNSLYFRVIEVYFSQPIVVTDSFIVGNHIAPSAAIGHDSAHYLCGPLYIIKGGEGLNRAQYTVINNGYLNEISPLGTGLPGVTDSISWGAPFPILTPAPCMPPIWLEVTEQHRQGATIEWRAQYANTTFEVEYGPQGFAEGTGTTVGPVAPDSLYTGRVTLEGLAMDADYTVRVRSYCQLTGGYSDWTEISFHTESYYVVATAVNNEEWGFVTGGGEYLDGSTVRLFAYPRGEHFPFRNWNDGSNQNPRIVTVTQDTAFTAVFDCDTCGTEPTTIATNDGMPNISLCPNPAKNRTTLRCSTPITAWTLYDIRGHAVASGTPNGTSAVIEMDKLAPAVYILRISTAYGTRTTKLIKGS